MSAAANQTTDIRELLPFFVNGTLEGDERAAVEAAIESESALFFEAEEMRTLRDAMHERPQEVSPGGFGLARLNREINQTTRHRRQRRVAASLAAMAAVAVFAAVAVVSLGPVGPDDAFIQASGETDVPAFTVTFQPDATEADISAALGAYDLTIVDGPSAVGLYRLAAPEGADLAAIGAALEARPQVFDMVDPGE